LTATEDRWGDLVGLCGSQKKLDVWRRFFKGFKQSIERFFGQHMSFVNDEDLASGRGRGVDHSFIELPDIVDPSVRSSIDLEHIQALALRDL
jgi:hypothetical protein